MHNKSNTYPLHLHCRIFLNNDDTSTNRSRRCWFVGCDINQRNKPDGVSLLSLPKQEAARKKWWALMGHDPNDSVPSSAKCCSRHIDTRLQRKFWIPIAGLANAFNSKTRRSGAVSRDATDVVQRQQQIQADQEAERREKARTVKIKKTLSDIQTDSLQVATKCVELQEDLEKMRISNSELQDNVKVLSDKLELQAPSKLSTLTDEWVRCYTPFKRKTLLVGFLMKIILPNIRHVWGFAGNRVHVHITLSHTRT